MCRTFLLLLYENIVKCLCPRLFSIRHHMVMVFCTLLLVPYAFFFATNNRSYLYFKPWFVHFWLSIHPPIHPSILCTVYHTQGRWDPGAYPRGLGAQGRGHPGQGANPSQGTITHIHTLRTIWKCQSAYNTSLHWRRKQEYQEEKHEEHMQTPHTQGWGGNRAPNPGGLRQTC